MASKPTVQSPYGPVRWRYTYLTGPGDLRVPETGPFRKRSRSRFLVLRNVRFYLSANISRGLGPPGQCTHARHAAPWLGAASRLAPAAARGARDGAPRGRGMRSKNRGRSGPAGVLARLATRTSGEWRPRLPGGCFHLFFFQKSCCKVSNVFEISRW